jgi:hypothetical protein
MLIYERESACAPEELWRLVARPDCWHRWAPQIRGAWHLGSPEVEPGRRGLIRLLGVIPVPARVEAKQPDSSWTWRVGLVDVEHRVLRSPGGSTVRITMHAPRPLERSLALTYGPVVTLALRNLVRVAERGRVA